VGLHQCPSERKSDGEPACSLHAPSHVPTHAHSAAKVRASSPAGLEFIAETDSPLEETVTSEPVSGRPYSLVTGKNTGKLVRLIMRAFLIFCDIKVLLVKFPSGETGNFAKPSSQRNHPYQGSFLHRSGKQLARNEARVEGPGDVRLPSPQARLAAITELIAAVLRSICVVFIVTDSERLASEPASLEVLRV
jgi:hypothetical protein